MADTIDELSIDIMSEIGNSDEALKKLSKGLSNLQSALGGINGQAFTSLSLGLQSLTESLNRFSGTKASDFSRVAAGLNKIGSVDATKLRSVADALQGISVPLGNLSNSRISINTAPLEKANQTIKQTTQNVSALVSKYAGTAKTPSFNVANMNTSQLESTLAKLQESAARTATRMQNIVNAGGNVNTVSFQNMQSSLDATDVKIETVKTRLQELADASQAALDKALKAAEQSATGNSGVSDYTKALDAQANSESKAAEGQRQIGMSAEQANAVLNTQAETVTKIRDVFAGLSSITPTVLQNGEEYSKEYDDLANSLQKATDQLDKLQGRMTKSVTLGTASGASWDSLNYDVDQKKQEYQAIVDQMESMQSEGTDVQLSDNFSNIASSTPSAESALMGFVNAAKKAGSVISSMANSINNFAQGVGNYAAKIRDATLAHFGLSKSGNDLVKSLLKVSNIFKLMLIRMALRVVIDGIKQGFENLSKTSLQVASDIQTLKNSLQYLGNSFAAAFAPIISAAIPYLNALIDALATAMNYIGQFFAILTGQGFFTKAIKLNTQLGASAKGAGSAAKGAAKDIKEATTELSIDELNVLNQNKDNSGGGGGGGGGAGAVDYNSMFEKAPVSQSLKDTLNSDDWSSIGKTIADKLNEAMANIPWDKIQAQAKHIALGIGTLINGFVSEFDWNLLGVTIGQGINTALIFAHTFMTTVDWGALGSGIATSINGLFNTIDWTLLGKTITDHINVIFETLAGFVTTLNWSMIGLDIGNAIQSGFDNINWDAIDTTISSGVNGIFNAISAMLSSVNWEVNAQIVTEHLNSTMSKINWYNIGSTIGQGANVIIGTLATILETLDWAQIGDDIGTTLQSFLSKVNWLAIGQALSSGAIGLLTMLSTAIQALDWGKVARDIESMLSGVDWGGVVRSIAEFLASVAGALLSVIAQWINDAAQGAADSISGEIEKCGGNVVQGFLKGIADAFVGIGAWIDINLLYPFLHGFMNSFGIHSPSTVMAEQGMYVVQGLIQGISENVQSCLDAVGKWATDTIDWFKKQLTPDMFSQYAEDIINGFKGGITSFCDTVADAIGKWVEAIKTAFGIDKLKSDFDTFAKNVVEAFGGSIDTNKSQTDGKMSDWASSIIKAFGGDENGSLVQSFVSAGENIVRGLIKGIDSLIGQAQQKFKDLADLAKNVVEKILEIHSPSKVFYRIGAYIVEGLTNGIDSESTNAVSTMKSLADSISKTASGNISALTLDNSTGKNISAWAKNDIVGSLANTVSTDNVTQVLQSIPTGVQNSWSTTIVKWNHSLNTWWNYDVLPWFAYPKWKNETDNIQRSMSDTWTETVTTWRAQINFWWSNDIVTLFTVSKWTEQTNHISDAVLSSLALTIANWKTEFDKWFSGDITTDFSLDKWSGVASNITTAITDAFQTATEQAQEAFDELVADVSKKISDLKAQLDALKSDSDDNESSSSNSGLNDGEVINNIPGCATGGYPNMGDLFIANEHGPEMVGTIGGRTAVANQNEITSALTSALAQGMDSSQQIALLQQSVSLLQRLVVKEGNVYLDSKTVNKSLNASQKRSGFSFT